MANDFNSSYDPYFYANEAINALHKALGLAGRVYRGYEDEWKAQKKGATISIPVPSTFTATNVNTSTGGTTQDIDTGEMQITLGTWKEVKFQVTEKTLSLGPERIISDHIAPAGYAIADAIDQSLCALILKVGNYSDFTSTPAWADFPSARKVLRDLGVPLNDGKLHMMVDSTIESKLLGMAEFKDADKGGSANQNTLMTGHIGTRLGMEFFANQNTPSHQSGASADNAGTATVSEGDETITISALTTGQTVKKGDIFTIAGDTQKYVFTADGTVADSALTAIGIFPAIKADSAENAVVTLENTTAKKYYHNLLFHENAFALAMAPLTEEGRNLGAQIATVMDPVTGLALRSRMFYLPDTNIIKVAIDALWGCECIDPNRATRVRRVYT